MSTSTKKPFSKTLRTLLVFLLLGSVMLSGCQAIKNMTSPEPTVAPAPVKQDDSTVIAEGHVVPSDFTNLYFTTAGQVTEILVKEGDQVSKGDTLAHLGDRQSFEANLASAELDLLHAQQQLDDLNEKAVIASSQANLAVLDAEQAYMDAQKRLEDIDTDETQDKIDDARKVVSDVSDEVENAQDEFDKYKDLDTDNQNRKDAEDKLKDAQVKYDQAVRDRDTLINDLGRAKEDLANAQARLNQARLDAEARQSGPDPDQLALAQAQVKDAAAQVAAAQSALDKLALVAPYAGRILRIDISAGERVQSNQTVLVLADTSSWYVETSDLTESEVVKISLDQPVTIKPDALPDVEIGGTVESIDETFIERAGDITYIVRIKLDETDPLLRWGMTVEARFGK
jgi:multidrug efflux pump subunit AcrA (membrane-fusion protein)